jgi:uncharacterized protein (DUF58 family)
MTPYYQKAHYSRGGVPIRSVARYRYQVPPLAPLEVGALAAVRSLPLRARILMEAAGHGLQRSRRIGSDLEFADYRDYQPGDDLKRIDWRLFARTDRLHVRRTHAETTLRVALLLDGSRSMAYAGNPGRLTKIDYARMLLGALLLIARRQRDPCGVGVLGRELVDWIAPTTSPMKFQAMWAVLERPATPPDVDWDQALDQALAVMPPRSLIVLASDFYVESARLEPALRRLHGEGHELVALRILDPVEIDFPFADPGIFFDVETGEGLLVDPAAAAEDYRRAFRRHAERLAEVVGAYGGELHTLRTDAPPLDVLRSLLAHRRRRG